MQDRAFCLNLLPADGNFSAVLGDSVIWGPLQSHRDIYPFLKVTLYLPKPFYCLQMSLGRESFFPEVVSRVIGNTENTMPTGTLEGPKGPKGTKHGNQAAPSHLEPCILQVKVRALFPSAMLSRQNFFKEKGSF